MFFQNIRPLGYTGSQSQGKLIILEVDQKFYCRNPRPTLNFVSVFFKLSWNNVDAGPARNDDNEKGIYRINDFREDYKYIILYLYKKISL